jgi:hypothetical protein
MPFRTLYYAIINTFEIGMIADGMLRRDRMALRDNSRRATKAPDQPLRQEGQGRAAVTNTIIINTFEIGTIRYPASNLIN